LDLQKPQLEIDVMESDMIRTLPRNSQLELDAQPAARCLPKSLNGPAVRVDDAEMDITVDIDLQKVEEDPVVQTISRSNDAEMDDAALAAVVWRRKMRPKATTKGYRKGLVC
jgi:hypothetical protein